MTIRVLVVDDSRFICKRIREILEEDPAFSVVGVAGNGLEAVEMSARLDPDVITMDVEMPVMDGITAVKRIMLDHPCPILMFSAMTQVGAQATLDALSAGAIDFLPKQLEDIDADRETAKAELRFRVRMVAWQAPKMRRNRQLKTVTANDSSQLAVAVKQTEPLAGALARIDLLVIAASTGGPVAIQQILSQVPGACRMPILLVQHMPPNFTKSFADRLNQLCQIKVREAVEGDILKPGEALLAPGGMQMQCKQLGGKLQVTLRAKLATEIYSPCIDTTLNSLAEVFNGHILLVVLTGMGADGREGAIRLKRQGAQIWAQDEASSTVYGMPKAIAEAHVADKIYSLDEIAHVFKKLN